MTTLIEPAFDFLTGESSFVLSRGEAKVCINGQKHSGTGEVRLELLPRAGVYFYGSFDCKYYFFNTPITSFSLNGCPVDGFLIMDKYTFGSKLLNIKWHPEKIPFMTVGNDATQMSRVIFHMFNFVDFRGMNGSIESKNGVSKSIEQIDLHADNWNLELRSLFETHQNFTELKARGGHHLTHIGCLLKSDATDFSGETAREHLQALQFFLSFAKGGWCAPVCAVGFDKDNKRVWESLSSPRDAWHTSPSWFDRQNSDQLAKLFSGFMSRWSDEDWREALHEGIYWYLKANNHSSLGIDGGIILTQAAIERLSFEFAVKEKRLLTVDGFKSLRASDKFRILFSSLRIPIDLSSVTPEIQKQARQQNWLDAPHALTEIRNSLIHPEHKQRGKFNSTRLLYEAWNLGLWYLEMSILSICGYSGTYGNRLKQKYVGQVEKVPWGN